MQCFLRARNYQDLHELKLVNMKEQFIKRDVLLTSRFPLRALISSTIACCVCFNRMKKIFKRLRGGGGAKTLSEGSFGTVFQRASRKQMPARACFASSLSVQIGSGERLRPRLRRKRGPCQKTYRRAHAAHSPALPAGNFFSFGSWMLGMVSMLPEATFLTKAHCAWLPMACLGERGLPLTVQVGSIEKRGAEEIEFPEETVEMEEDGLFFLFPQTHAHPKPCSVPRTLLTQHAVRCRPGVCQ